MADKPLEGEIIPPGTDLPAEKPCPLDTGVKITVDMLKLMQDGEDPFFAGWTQKWSDFKSQSPRDKWAIDGDAITATDPSKDDV